MTELESTVVSLEAKLEDHRASTTNKVDVLGGHLEALKGEVVSAVAAAKSASSTAAATAASTTADVTLGKATDSPSKESVRMVELESELQAVHAKISDLIMSTGSTAGAVSEALTALTQRIEANDLALEEVKAAAAAAAERASAAASGPFPSSGTTRTPSPSPTGDVPDSAHTPAGAESVLSRLTALEDQGATFKRFVVEAIKRTTDLSTAVQDHGKAIAALHTSSSAAGASWGPPSTSSPDDVSTVGGGGGGLVTVEQLSSLEFKITQTLTQMHQMHVAKIQEWEEQLVEIEGQVQQLSEEQQQLWLHASGKAPPPPVVLVNAPQQQAAENS